MLAPVVVLFAVYVLSATLVASRRDAWELLQIMVAAAVANLALNLALIPLWGAVGAAAAMLGSSIVYITLSMRVSLRETGAIDLVSLLASPIVAGVAMAAALLVLQSSLILALVAGSAVYVAVTAVVERIGPRGLRVRDRPRPPRAAHAYARGGGLSRGPQFSAAHAGGCVCAASARA